MTMSDEVTLKRIEIIEARVSDLEKRLNSVSDSRKTTRSDQRAALVGWMV